LLFPVFRLTHLMNNYSLKPRHLAYVDDNANDIFLFQWAVRKASIPFHVQTFLSAEQILAYLRGDTPFSNRNFYPYPEFLLCDYNLGYTTGAALVKQIRTLPPCKDIPIIMFSGIIDGERMPLSYAAGADYFLCKPEHPAPLEEIVKTLWACATASPPRYDLIQQLPEYEHCPKNSSRLLPA